MRSAAARALHSQLESRTSTFGVTVAVTAGAGAINFTTGARATITAGIGAVHTATGAGAAITARVGEMYSTTGARWS